MYVIIYLLILLTAAYIGYEDFKYRAVSWILFPLLAILGILSSMALNESKALVFIYAGINLFIVIIQFTLLKIYLAYIKGRRVSLSTQIGKGDILFIMASAFFFSPINFIIYLVLSLVFALSLHIICIKQQVYPGKSTTVPLAGLQSAFLAICISVSQPLLQINITDDSWILYNLFEA